MSVFFLFETSLYAILLFVCYAILLFACYVILLFVCFSNVLMLFSSVEFWNRFVCPLNRHYTTGFQNSFHFLETEHSCFIEFIHLFLILVLMVFLRSLFLCVFSNTVSVIFLLNDQLHVINDAALDLRVNLKKKCENVLTSSDLWGQC